MDPCPLAVTTRVALYDRRVLRVRAWNRPLPPHHDRRVFWTMRIPLNVPRLDARDRNDPTPVG